MNTDNYEICGTFSISRPGWPEIYTMHCNAQHEIANRYGYKFSITQAARDVLKYNRQWTDICCNIHKGSKTIKFAVRPYGEYLGTVATHVMGALCTELFITDNGVYKPVMINIEECDQSADGKIKSIQMPDILKVANHHYFTMSFATRYLNDFSAILPTFEDGITYVGISKHIPLHLSKGTTPFCTWESFSSTYVKKAYLEELIGCSLEEAETALPIARVWPLGTHMERDCVSINGRVVLRRDFKQLCDMDVDSFIKMAEKTTHSTGFSSLISLAKGKDALSIMVDGFDKYIVDGVIDTSTIGYLISFDIRNGGNFKKYRIVKDGINLKAEKV